MQQAFVDHGAIQCGFCMPGMIMQADYLAENNPDMDRQQMQRGLEGKLGKSQGLSLHASDAESATKSEKQA